MGTLAERGPFAILPRCAQEVQVVIQTIDKLTDDVSNLRVGKIQGRRQTDIARNAGIAGESLRRRLDSIETGKVVPLPTITATYCHRHCATVRQPVTNWTVEQYTS